jgi:hypothetical protein
MGRKGRRRDWGVGGRDGEKGEMEKRERWRDLKETTESRREEQEVRS